MGDFFQRKPNDSWRQENINLNLFANSSTTLPQHHQISQTIFWCLNAHTCDDDDDDMNREIIDISDDEGEEDENVSQNGSVVCLDDNDIEVIELSDESEDEVNDESSGENSATLDNHEINQLSMNEQLQHQQPTDFDSLGPSTSQKEQYQLEEEKDNANGAVSRDRVLITLGLSCRECLKLFDTQLILEQHLMGVHAKLPFRCMVRGCNEQFSDKSLLSQHYADHRTNQTKFICSAVNCTFVTSLQQNFLNHVYKYHEKGLFQCSLCLVQYSHRIKVFHHYTNAHKHAQNKAQKLFSCQVDSCRFVGRNNCHLKLHLLTHTQLRPFRCTWSGCGFAMNRRVNLIGHIRVKHLHIPRTKKEAAQRNIQCDQNPNQFVERISFDT